MAHAGRVLNHLQHGLGNPKNSVAFVGYQAAGTNGDRLLQGAKSIQISRKDVPVRAQVSKIDGSLSGHADKMGLLHWAKQCGNQVQCYFLTHGDNEQRSAFQSLLKRVLKKPVYTPALNEVVDLGARPENLARPTRQVAAAGGR
jgi:metallo-beta-lactamase family protein